MNLIKIVLLLLVSFPILAENTITKVGVVVPLTGGASSNGLSIKNAVTLSSEKFDPDQKIEFIFEDDQLKPKNTVNAVMKLIQVDKVTALIVFGTPTSLAVAPIAEGKKIPMIAISMLDSVVKDKEFVVKHFVTADAIDEALRQYLEIKQYSSYAVVATTNDSMLKLKELFSKSQKNIVYQKEFNPEETDFKAVASKIKQLNPTATYNLLWAPQTSLLSKELRKAGYQGDIFGAPNLEDPNEVKVSNGALLNSYYVTGNDREGQEFYDLYEEKYHTLPASGAINAFDISKMIIEGFNSGDLNKYLHTVKDFKGANGTYSATGKNDFTLPATLKVITTQGFEHLD